MIKFAAKPPAQRKAAIAAVRGSVAYETNDRIKGFGVEVEPTMMRVPGRVLLPPRVQYHPSSKKQPNVNAGYVASSRVGKSELTLLVDPGTSSIDRKSVV